MINLLGFLGLALLQVESAGQQLQFKVLDIVYTVQDLETKVQKLQVKETDTEVHIELAADVLFDFDKADILPKAEETLKQTAKVVRQHDKGVVRIEGHTDSKGLDPYNQKLSLKRAESVKAWLIKQDGLRKVRFATAGFGAARPVAPNTKPDGSDDPEARQKNRRVEIILQK